MRGEERGCIEKGSYITVTSVTTVTKFFIFSLSIGDCKWFKYALSHKWSVYNSLPKKLVLYKHKLLGSAATWVPNSLPAHVQTGPSSVSCALLSLETKESYHRPVQEQDWLLWNPQEGLGLLQGRSWFLPLTRRDRAMVLQRDKPCFPAYTPKLQEVSCLSQPPSVQGHIFLHYNTKDFNIKWSFAEKKKSTLMMFSRISFSHIYEHHASHFSDFYSNLVQLSCKMLSLSLRPWQRTLSAFRCLLVCGISIIKQQDWRLMMRNLTNYLLDDRWL